ncbi:hypothetical protein [Streptomyces sp. NPDC051567]|uniref:pPIWI_RE_Z domain-containing protein n=1 Tax=Streptomyces sp. NPDC051567 TaxID=3365660 RepID=UPI00379491FD
MRDIAPVTRPVVDELAAHPGHRLDRTQLEELCRVETGLLLLETLLPGTSVVAGWVLFGGHPFARVWSASLDPGAEAVLRTARQTLWPFQERSAWHNALNSYQKAPAGLRGYEVPAMDQPPARRPVLGTATGRWAVYRRLLEQAPPFAQRRLLPATAGAHTFTTGRTAARVELPVLDLPASTGHDLGLARARRGAVRFTYGELLRTAAGMDAEHPAGWVGRLRGIRISTRTGSGFSPAEELTVEGLQHLVGRERAARQTLRDVIAVYMARARVGRVTVIVGEESEALRLVRLYNTYAGRRAAAPVIAPPGVAWHIDRLHRKELGRGEPRLITASDSALDYLSTSCVMNELRTDPGADTSLAFGDAPCCGLRSASGGESGGEERSCPFWSACPRHRATRALVGADIWVATLSGLLEVSPSPVQNSADVRLLELACRRSDLVLVDNADRAQQALDRAFAPARSLVGGRRPFLEELRERKRRALLENGRPEPADRHVEIWAGALDTSQIVAEKLHGLLAGRPAIDAGVDGDCFSARSVQLGLVEERHPRCVRGDDAAASHIGDQERQRLFDRLDEFRKDPFGDLRPPESDATGSELTVLLSELIHTGDPRNTHARLGRVTDRIFASGAAENHRSAARPGAFTARFELFLLLSALESRLALLMDVWPHAEPSIRAGFNPLSTSPVDFRPLVPASPMGELLGFRFDGRAAPSGELGFVHCHGVGRELLGSLPHLPEADGLPGTNVLLMSGTGWAGTSSRSHLSAPVGVVVEPVTPVADCLMRDEPELSGENAPPPCEIRSDERSSALRDMTAVLGAGLAEGAAHGGPLERQLMLLPEGRDHLLMIVGSYDEAALVADTLHGLSERWHGRVLRLARDDTKLPVCEGDGERARVLLRGELSEFKDRDADVLVAPLTALDPRHRVLNGGGTGAFGAVYFLGCPHHHPRDLGVAVSTVNDWIVRATAGGDFATWVRAGAGLDGAALDVRRRAENTWRRALHRGDAWSVLGEDRPSVSWDLIVLMSQAIGLAQDGGEPVHVVLVDPAFAPGRHRVPRERDTAESSRLRSMLEVLAPYFTPGTGTDPHDRHVAQALYGPLWSMLNRYLDGSRDPR